MSISVKKIERELHISGEEVVKQFLGLEFKNLSAEISKLGAKYDISSFDELWEKLEKGKISESECFDDLTKLEYLELHRDKISKLLDECP